jgi:large subunit ribosomal protein L25
MAHVSLTAQPREEFGNGPARRLRQQGRVPGVVYQPGGPSLAFSLSDRDLRRAIHEGRTGVIDLVIGDAPARPVLLKDAQLHPLHLNVVHVDFQEVDLTQVIEAPVQVTLVSTPVGVRDGGVLDQPLREVVVSALPDSLPDHLELDVAELTVGDSLTVADLRAPEGVTIVTDAETVVASVVAPSEVVIEEEDEEISEVDEADAGGGETSDD